jgi:hypothetical protein
MKRNYYLIEVEGGVEPIVRGPYHTKHERDNAAKQIRLEQREDDGLFWADIDEAGTLAAGAYRAGFFWDEPTEGVDPESFLQ